MYNAHVAFLNMSGSALMRSTKQSIVIKTEGKEVPDTFINYPCVSHNTRTIRERYETTCIILIL